MRICVYHQIHVFDDADNAASLVTRRATVDDIQTGMVERLIQLGRVEPDFDPLTWTQDIRSYKAPARKKAVYNLGKGITSEKDYVDAITAQKLTPAYISHMAKKPAGNAPRSFNEKTAQLMVDHIKSTTYTSQAGEKITTTAQAEKAEGNRLLTYLYHSVSVLLKRIPKGKDAKAPESADMPENPTDDEE